MREKSLLMRAFTTMVACVTMFSTFGFAAMVGTSQARAASLVAGDLIRGTTLSTVYYYAADGHRYAFPNLKTYQTWYPDFSMVQTISDSELAAVPLAGNIAYRPGSRWMKIMSDPKTYSVSPDGAIHWIESESVAKGLGGSDWNTMIDDVPDVFFVDYTVGASLMDAGDAYDGALVKMDGKTYLVWDGEKREVTDAGFSANRFQERFILSDGAGIDLVGLAAGSTINTELPTLTDAAQITTDDGSTTPSQGQGALSVSIASDTPAAETLPASASSVEVAKFKLTATSGDVDISQLLVQLGGIGSTSNFSKVYLYEGDNRLTNGKTFNSTTRKATFSGLSWTIDQGDTMNLSVRVDLATSVTGGDTAKFGIASAADIIGPASVSGSFGVYGNSMSLSSTSAGELTVTKSGSISNPKLGQEGAEIGKFKVQASSTEGAYIHDITLEVDNASDHSNYKLWQSSTQVSTGEYIGGKSVRFSFDTPFYIKSGNSSIFTASADIGGQANDLIKVAIDEPADIYAIGDKYGFNLMIDTGDNSGSGTYNETSGSCAGTSDNCTYSTIEGGKLTFVFQGPSAHDVQVDGSDVIIAKYSITAANATTLNEIDLIVACTSSSSSGCDSASDAGDLLNSGNSQANLTDITFKLDSNKDGVPDSVFMGPEELSTSGSDTSQTLTFTDSQTLEAGKTVDLYVTADIDSQAVSGDIYNVTMDMSGVKAEDVNGDTLASTDIVPTSDLTSNNITTRSASMTVAVSKPPSSATYVKGVSNVNTVGFSFQSGTASDTKVTDLTVQAYGDNDGTITDLDKDLTVRNSVSSCSLYDSQTGALVSGPESPSSSDKLIFTNFNWTVKGGTTSKLLLRCNFSNTALTSSTDDVYWFQITANTDVTVEDTKGSSVTPTLTTGNSDAGVATTITDVGTVSISLDGSSPTSDIILGLSTGVQVAAYKLSATKEDFDIQNLTFRNCKTTTADADLDCADSGEASGSDAIASTVKISYVDSDGATATVTGFLSGGVVTFRDIPKFVVKKDQTSIVKVWVDTNEVSASGGATSGTYIQLNLSADSDETDAEAFKAVGVASGTTIDTDTSSLGSPYVMGKYMQVRKTKPTINVASGTPSGASIPGFNKVYKMNVSADSRGYVTLNELLFQVTSTDNVSGGSKWNRCGNGTDTKLASATKWKFYNDADPSRLLDDDGDWAFLKSTGAACTSTEDAVLSFAKLDFTGSSTTAAEEIGAGQTKTYVLEVDSTGASSSSDDSLRFEIPTEATADALTTTARDACNWFDDTVFTSSNIDCGLIKSLPATGGTMVY